MRVIRGPRQYIALKCFQLTFGTKEKWESSVSFPVLKQKRVNRGFFRARSTTSLKLPHHNSNCCSAILPSGPPQIIRPLEYAVSKQMAHFYYFYCLLCRQYSGSPRSFICNFLSFCYFYASNVIG